ncbi:MAG: hypothetical protein JNG88_14355 [Phycisphaerales bacterium]|nr:hypothetical protein [Phycisphaerales bacterium]
MNFRKVCVWLCGGLGLMQDSNAVRAEVVMDAVCSGDRCYLRTAFLPNEPSYAVDCYICADAGVGAVAYVTGPAEDLRGYVTHFDPWGRRLHEPALIDQDHSYRPYYMCADRSGDVTAVFWRSGLVNAHFLRNFDSSGVALCNLVRVNDISHSAPGNWTVSVGPQRVAATMIRNTQVPPKEIVSAVYSPFGEPLSSAPPFDTQAGYAVRPKSSITVNGDLLLAYSSGVSDPYEAGVFHRVFADASGQTPAFAEPFANPIDVWPLNNGLAALAFVNLEEGSPDFAVEFIRILTLDGEPVGDLIRLASASTIDIAGDRDGGVAQLSIDENAVMRVAVYDHEFSLVSPAFPIQPAAINAPNQDTIYIAKPLALDPNGTIWLAWHARSGPDANIYIGTLQPFLPGDMNRDGLVNNFDIDAFVFALSNLPGYAATYNIPEGAAVIIGDINEDGFLNNFDIDPFVSLLAEE